MDVLFVTPSYFPIVGGSEVLTRSLSGTLGNMGIHADILTLNMNRKWNPLWKGNIEKDGRTNVFKEPALNPFPNLPNPLFNMFRMNVIPKPSFAGKLRDYDIIHFIGEADLSFPLFSYFIRRPKLFQCAGMYRNGGIYKYYMSDRAFLGKTFRRFFPKLADVFIISSDEERELLLEIGVPCDKILILPVGVDTHTFRSDESRKSDNLIVFAGRIEKIKGLHILIESLAYVDVPVHLAIIGATWDADYAKHIEDQSETINEKGFHKVMFLGNLDQHDLVPWYQRASVVVCPFLYETYSNVIRESLACGTPVISTGSHLVENGSDGIILASKDPRDIARCLSKLLKEREMRIRLGREGRRIIEQYFSWESIVKNLINVYRTMLAN